jgi:hypothetical protein
MQNHTFAMFEPVPIDDIKKDLARIPARKRQPTEAQAERAYWQLLAKLKTKKEKEQKEKQKENEWQEYLCK